LLFCLCCCQYLAGSLKTALKGSDEGRRMSSNNKSRLTSSCRRPRKQSKWNKVSQFNQILKQSIYTVELKIIKPVLKIRFTDKIYKLSAVFNQQLTK